MFDIFEGIYSAFVSDSTLSGAVTGLYPVVAPEDADFPYITYHWIASNQEWDFGLVKYETPLIQFSIFSDDVDNPSEILQIWSDLTAVFDNVSLSLDNYNQVYFTRGNSIGPMRIEGEEVLVLTTDYDGMFREK